MRNPKHNEQKFAKLCNNELLDKCKHIQHYDRLAKKPAHVSVPIISSKLLLHLANQPLMASPSSFERKIETEIHAGFYDQPASALMLKKIALDR